MNKQAETRSVHGVNSHMLSFLVCPATKQSLIYGDETQELISPAAGLAYTVRGSIPIMLIDEARELEEAERARYKKK